jgi:hypothetical protein
MVNEMTGEPHTYHTTQPVSLFVIGDRYSTSGRGVSWPTSRRPSWT